MVQQQQHSLRHQVGQSERGTVTGMQELNKELESVLGSFSVGPGVDVCPGRQLPIEADEREVPDQYLQDQVSTSKMVTNGQHSSTRTQPVTPASIPEIGANPPYGRPVPLARDTTIHQIVTEKSTNKDVEVAIQLVQCADRVFGELGDHFSESIYHRALEVGLVCGWIVNVCALASTARLLPLISRVHHVFKHV